MLKRLLNWLGLGETPDTGAAMHAPGPESHPEPDAVETLAPPAAAEGALIRNKYLREDTGTHETLKILDDSIIDSGEEEGFDPYNTGDFDRSRNWDRRFRG